jgi:predicted amino acid dehydrogenase
LAFEHALKNGVPVETLYAIMRQGPEKAIQLGPMNAQTGPAIRGDESTIAAHLSKIEDDQLKALYLLLSDSIHNTHNR